MNFTTEALQEMIDSFTKKGELVPFYDSDDPDTRKEIGKIVNVWLDPECQTQLLFEAELFDGKIIKGRTS